MSKNVPRAGDLRQRVKLQSFSGTRDALGEIDPFAEGNWTTDATLWANVQSQSGNEGTEGDQVSPEVTHTVSLRYRKGVVPSQRILYRKLHTILDGELNTTNGTAVTVADALAVPERNKFILEVGTELMQVSAGHGTVNLTAARGANNSTPATHADGADVFIMGALNIEGVTDPDNNRESLMVSCKETL